MKVVDLDDLEHLANSAAREHEDWYRSDDLVEDRALCGDDADHIAANSPAVTLALVARIRELEAGYRKLMHDHVREVDESPMHALIDKVVVIA